MGRQPFGGYKKSAYGRGLKAGGPNYLLQFCKIKESSNNNSSNIKISDKDLHNLEKIIHKHLEPEYEKIWRQTVASYISSYEDYFIKNHDPQDITGQANILRYKTENKCILLYMKMIAR